MLIRNLIKSDYMKIWMQLFMFKNLKQIYLKYFSWLRLKYKYDF